MLRRLFYGLVVVFILAAGYAWAAFDKTVTVELDGRPVAVRTFARTVGGVLEHAELSVAEHDLLAPAKDVPVKEGSRIVLRRGRPLTLRLNGVERTVWVTALSVDEALAQLGVRADGAFVSASRSRELPLNGFAVEIRQPAKVRILDAGQARDVVTTAPTVRHLLAERGVKLAPTDKLSHHLHVYPAAGTTLRITRIRASRIVETDSVPFTTVRKADPTMYVDNTTVDVSGRNGVRELVYAVTYTNGKMTSKKLVSNKVTVPPRAKVVRYGTKKRTVDTLNWRALARCESGGNPRAVSSSGTYRGLYQFTYGTWYSVGGTGDPIDASAAEQTYRAKRLYLRRGWRPWPVCGRLLFT